MRRPALSESDLLWPGLGWTNVCIPLLPIKQGQGWPYRWAWSALALLFQQCQVGSGTHRVWILAHYPYGPSPFNSFTWCLPKLQPP